MKLRLVSAIGSPEEAAVDALMGRALNGHFTQHPGWVKVPAEDSGGRWHWVLGEVDGQLRFSALARVRKAPALGYALVDVFRGPMAACADDLADGLGRLEESVSPLKPLALRVDPFCSEVESPRVREALEAAGFIRMEDPPFSHVSLQTPIDRPAEELLASFRKETRYDVRRALKMQIDVREDLDDAGVEGFEALYQGMVRSKGAHPRPRGYFAAIRDHFRRWPRSGFFLSAWKDDELLGAAAIFTCGARAIYGYGASGSAHPGIPRTHLLHFLAMQRARQRGCLLYDMGGFGAGVGQADRRSPAQKINYFKSGFGGVQVEFIPAHELVLRPAAFRALRAVRRILR